MAKNQNIRDQQELNRLTREYEVMLNRVNSLRARIGQNPIKLLAPEETGNIRNLTSAIKTLADESSALNEQLSEAKKSFVGLNDEIKQFGKHLEEQNKGIENLVDSFKTVTQEVKTLTKDLAEIKIPSLTQRIGFEIDALPEIVLPELKQRITYTTSDVPTVDLPDLQQNISYALGVLPTPELPNLEQRVNYVIGTLPTTELPELQQKINYVLGTLPTTELPELQQKINYVLGTLPSTELPELQQKINYVLGTLPTTELPELQQKINYVLGTLPSTELPELQQKINYVLGEIPQIDLSDVQRRVNITVGDLPEIPSLGDKVLNIVVKGVEEAEAIFKKLAEPFTKTLSVGEEVKRTAQEVQPPPPIRQSVEVRIDDSYVNAVATSLEKTTEEVKKAMIEAGAGSRNLLSSAIDIQGAYNAIRGSLEEVGNATDKTLNRSLKSMRAIYRISESLALDAEGTSKLSLKELQQKQKDFDLARDRLDLEKNKLRAVTESITASEADKARAREALAFINDEVKALDDIGIYNEARIKQEKEITQLMGAGGALIKGATTLMTKLGFSSQAFGDGLERAEEKMRETAEQIQSGAKAGGRLTVLMSGLGGLASGFGTALTDPLVIIGRIAAEFIEVNKAAVELQRLTGTNESAAAGVNNRLITSVEYLKTAAELTKEIGLAANAIFDSTQLAALSEAQKLLGLSAEQTANLGLRAQLVGDTVDGFQDSILAGADAANRMGKSAVAPGIVLQDVLNTSEEISLSLGQNPKALGKAAVAARAFGMTLEQVNKIASGLLDFESSIESELEAQLLTGRNIQLSRARELALVNDLEGLSRELANQGVRAADFANMNRIQQESVAQALGMSRDELAKSLVAQAAQGELTDDQRAKVLGVTREQLAQLDVQQKLKDSLAKLAQAFSPMLDILIPFVELVGMVLTPIAKFVGWIMQGAKALGEMIPSFGKVGESASWIEETLASISGILKSIPSLLAGAGLLSLGNMFKNLFSGKGVKFDLFKKAKEKIGGITEAGKKAAETGSQVADAVTSTTPKPSLKPPTPATTAAPGGGVAQTVSRVNATALLKGAAAMAVAAGGIYIFAKAVQELAKVEDYGKVAIGLGLFIGSMAAAAAVISFASPAFWAATPILLGFGAALVLAAGAFALASLGFNSFGNLLDKLSIDKIGSLLLLGPALGSVAAGLTALSIGGILGLAGVAVLGTLASMAPGLKTASEAVSLMAREVGALSTALKEITPESVENLKKIMETGMEVSTDTALSKVSEPIMKLVGVLGGGSDSGEGDQGKLLAKLDELIRVVKEGGNVYINGERFAQSLVQGATKGS